MRDPAVLEQIDTCRTVIFDKTGTLTYGEPQLIEQIVCDRFATTHKVLMLAAKLGALLETSAGGIDPAGSAAECDGAVEAEEIT